MLTKAALFAAALLLRPIWALWPAPKDLSLGTCTLFISQDVKFYYNGQQVCPNKGSSSPRDAKPSSRDIIQSGVSRALDAIFEKNFVPWKLRPRGSNLEPNWEADQMKWITSVNITQTKPDGPRLLRPLAGDVDESYSLDVSTDGDVQLQCCSSTGCLHGLESFVQLFFLHGRRRLWYTPHAPVQIRDEPKFPHRGILMDVARNWFPVEDIKRTIDAMAWNKMNRLHLHVTDSQSWPLEIPSLPHLAEKGAYRKGLTYSPSDIEDIYLYGLHRGVGVVMEIDMPGHTGAIALSEEDLIVAYNQKPYHWYCAEPPCGAFRMNSTKVYDFLDKLFDDLLPRLAPYTAYFHTGGDELNRNDSMLDPDVRSNQTEVIAPLLQTFLDFVHEKVRSKGLAPVVWEEMITDWNMTLGKDVLVQSWLGQDAVKKLAEAGHKVIDSNFNFWYLDCGRGQWLNFDNGKAFQTYYPFNDWCNPTKSWRLVYAHDPTAGLSQEAARLVLGGEVAVWSELIDSTNLDSIIWPRASAAGEVLWSGRHDAAGQNRSQYEAAPRLAELRERMVARGVAAMPVQMIFCTQGNATECAQLAD